MTSVFISYGRENAAEVGTLAQDISGLGHQVWFDQDLSGGQAWWAHILETIRKHDVFVFALSPASLDSQACKLEYDYAVRLGRPILPVLISEGVSVELLPSSLAQLQYVDYRRADKEALKALGKAFTGLPPSSPLPDPLPEPPVAPVSYLSSLGELIDARRPLSFEEQTAIVVRLKHGLRDDSPDAELARTLLRKLRLRDDLYAKVAEEVDDSLRGATSVRGHVSVPPPVYVPPPPAQPLVRDGPPPTPATQHKSAKPRPAPPPEPAPPGPITFNPARSGIAGPMDFMLAIIFGVLLQGSRSATLEGGTGLLYLVSYPLWALYGSTFLLALAVWRRARAKPTVMRMVCMVWPVVGGFLIAASILLLASAGGLELFFHAFLFDLHWWAALVQWGFVAVMLLREPATKPVSLGQMVWVIAGGQAVALLTGYAG